MVDVERRGEANIEYLLAAYSCHGSAYVGDDLYLRQHFHWHNMKQVG